MTLWRPPVLPLRGLRDSPWEWAGPGAAQAAALDMRYSPPQGRLRSMLPPPWTAPKASAAAGPPRQGGGLGLGGALSQLSGPLPLSPPSPLLQACTFRDPVPKSGTAVPTRSVSEQPAQRKPELISISKAFFLSPKLGVPPSFSLPAEPVGMKRCPFSPLGLSHCMGRLENKQFQCLSF